ncbi:MAG: 16S rRNA (guanine(527)-N(7))-methyltransferase RsmG, partial [Muribaculaceae bacterium]
GLTNVTFQHGDIKEVKDKYDFVVSRAVMLLDELVPLIKRNISPINNNSLPNGLICLKGGDVQGEIKNAKASTLVTNLKDYFDEPFFETKKVIYVQI